MGHGLLQRGLGYAILFVLALAVFTEVQYVFHNRVKVQQLGAAGTSVTLTDNSDSYFDEYLDEIVYFFDATKVDIVIFEDIDRFDDPHIFETLRELNTILNTSKQLGDRNVRFIYAIKDSIFEQLGCVATDQKGSTDAAEAEVARANRTKFFDLVIPVVPFITHRSARDLMTRMLEESRLPISRELVDLVARHVADMRLITNIRNEFVVFREKLLGGDGVEGLTEDQLFAMILYKNVHLSDFELIRTGSSRLDELYQASRVLVNQNIRSLNIRARQLRRTIVDPDPLPSRSDELGKRLEAYITRVVSHGVPQGRIYNWQLVGQTTQMISSVYLHETSFWRVFLKPGSSLQLMAGNGNKNVQFTFTASDIGAGIGESLAADRWKQQDQDAARQELVGNERTLALLAHADMKDLIDRPDLTLNDDYVGRSFAEILKQMLDSQLAIALVANGYIDQNFALYISQYHGVHVRKSAMNFILHNVQPDVVDPYFRFSSPADIDAVLHESGLAVLNERSMYNIAILDHLLKNRPADADTVIRRLTMWGPDEQDFVQFYAAAGEYAPNLIRRLSALRPQTLSVVVRDLDVDEDKRAVLVNAVLLGIDFTKLKTPDGAITRYIERTYHHLSALIDEGQVSQAERMVTLLELLGVRLDEIEPLSGAVRQGVVEHRLYVISRENLVSALGGGSSLSLDGLQAANEHVYLYVLDTLFRYLDVVLDGTPFFTIETPDRFTAILEDVADHDPTVLQTIVDCSSPDCFIDDLAKIRDLTWPALASDQRFPLTITNVQTYVAQYGVDEKLAVALLAHPELEGSDAAFGDEMENLAVAILAADKTLADPGIRVRIVRSLELDSPIPAGRINWERGQLAGLLVTAGLVDDDGATYDAVASTDWATREFLISKSENFGQYITPAQLPAADLGLLLESKLIDNATKNALLTRLSSFATAADQRAVRVAADYAVRHQLRLDMDTLLLFASVGVTGETIVRLLHPLIAEVPIETLTALLEAMGTPYDLLAAPGYRQPKLLNNAAHRALVDHLKTVGAVSSFDTDKDEKTIKVYMKRP
jgi:hypothetical protein